MSPPHGIWLHYAYGYFKFMHVVSSKNGKSKKNNNDYCIFILRYYCKAMTSYIDHLDQEGHGLAEKIES